MLLLQTFALLLRLSFGEEVSYEWWEDKSLPKPSHTLELGHHNMRVDRRLDSLPAELTPLYPGYGTHFAYVYVGTPPQRQSVIVDTGSHYTAFPCVGCSNCGKHTDSYWDPKQSSTVNMNTCGSSSCRVSQSYAEGSSWSAVLYSDKLWVGGLTKDLLPNGDDYTVDFKFGCQSSETGLFRTQLADGIMGMSIADDTLQTQLFKQQVTSSKIFALCFKQGGGIMTLGGVDQRIHTKTRDGFIVSDGLINYAALAHPPGSSWYTVTLMSVALKDPVSGSNKPLGLSQSQLNTGKGVIVDSGTTDTYLPSSLNAAFGRVFKEISGVGYTSANVALTDEQLKLMPSVVFTLLGTDGKPFEVVMPPLSYVESVGDNKYAFRIYNTEGSGAVLGANFMNEQNIIFDTEGGRIGFAKSTCRFEDFVSEDSVHDDELAVIKSSPTLEPTAATAECVSSFVPVTDCIAWCDAEDTGKPYVANGVQEGYDSCTKAAVSQTCHQLCDKSSIAIGFNSDCLVGKWSECYHNCSQWRVSYPAGTTQTSCSAATKSIIETRKCNVGACPVYAGDEILIMDFKVNIPAHQWSYAYANTFEDTLMYLFSIPKGSIDILSSTVDHSFSPFVKIRFEIRLEKASFSSLILKFKKLKIDSPITQTAESIVVAVQLPEFKEKLISGLNYISKQNDMLDHCRFCHLEAIDIEVMNAMTLPLAANDRPDSISFTNNSGHSSTERLLFGFLCVMLVVLGFVLYSHVRLRKEHYDLQSRMPSIGERITNMIHKAVNPVKKDRDYKYDKLSTEIQMADMELSDDENAPNKKQSA